MSILTLQHRVDHLESVVDLLADLGTCQDDLPTHKDQKYDLRPNHAIDQAREQFRFIRTEIVMATSQTLQANGEFDVAGADNILDLEVGKLRVESKLLNNARVFARGQLRIIL